MATEVLCPICGATYNLAEGQIGKKLRCRKCEHAFVAGGKGRGRSNERDEPDDEIQSSPRRSVAKSGRRRDEDEDDDRPRKKTPPLEKQAKARSDDPGGFPVKTFVLAGVGIFVLLFVCGGGGLTIYWLTRRGASAPPPMANQGNPFPAGGFVPGMPPPAGPMRPIDGGLNDPFRPAPAFANADEALAALRANDAGRRLDGARWFAEAPVDAARQAEVAKALNPLLAATEQEGIRNAAAMACKKWGTDENVTGLSAFLEKNHDNIFTKDQRVAAMHALARIKDERGAAAVARELPDHFIGDEARNALREFGPKAEKAVAKALFQPDPTNRATAAANELLRGYSTKEEVILEVALGELTAGNDNQRQGVLQWLGQAKPNPAKAPEVARALNGFLDSNNEKLRNAAVLACKVWATTESVPALASYLEKNATNFFSREQRAAAMQALARLKDERGTAAIAGQLRDHNVLTEAKAALKEIGPSAEKFVAPLLFFPDPFNRTQQSVRELLQGYGTKDEVIVPHAAEALLSTDNRRREMAAGWLEKAPAIPALREDVAKAVNVLLLETDASARTWGTKVAAVWGTKENVPTLVRILDDKNLGAKDMRGHAMRALAGIKEEDGVWPVALWVGDFFSGKDADAAILAFGPAAEKGLVKHVGDLDAKARERAWKLLSAVGTQATVAEARAALAKEVVPQLKSLGNAALQIMQKRPAPKPA